MASTELLEPVEATTPHSILFGRSGEFGSADDELEPPDFLGDLNLDQVLQSMTAGREEYELEPFFCRPLHDVAAVRYRHEVLRDLQRRDVLESIEGFARELRRMREHLAQAEKLHYALQKQAWFLDAVEIYCDAVRSLLERLGALDVTSRGFQALREHLTSYTGSERFASLEDETRTLKAALADVRYTVRIRGNRVTVATYEGEPDYSAEVEATFARFQQGAVNSYLVKLRDFVEMNHVEARILDLVARLYPDVFGALHD